MIESTHVRSDIIIEIDMRYRLKKPNYEGPFKIVDKLSPTVFILESNDSRRIPKTHASKLKRYLPPDNS